MPENAYITAAQDDIYTTPAPAPQPVHDSYVTESAPTKHASKYGAYGDASDVYSYGGGGGDYFSDDEDDGGHDEIPHQPNPKGLRVKEMNDHYKGEQHNASFRGSPEQLGEQFNMIGNTPNANFTFAKTNYLRPEEQAKAAVSVHDGKLVRDGKLLDTGDASGIGTVGWEGKGKHIFAMSPDEQVRSIDPWAAHTETPKDDEGTEHTIGLVNHSSLAAVENKDGDMVAGKVAAAGEIAAENGKLTQISDGSGHYRPDNVMTHQAVQSFANQGVDMHDVAMKLTKKNFGEEHLHASAREFMSYEGAADAEEKMRDRRDVMRAGITQAAGDFDARRERGVMRQGGTNVMSTEQRRDPRTGALRKNLFKEKLALFGGMY